MNDDESRAGHPLLSAATIEGMSERRREHRINPRATRHSRSLGDATGLAQIGVHLVRIAPGDETTEHHFHHFEEEFVYVLSGRGRAEIGDETFEVGPGDFMGFARLSPAHSMANPYEEDFVYLVGGTRPRFDVCEYPRSGKRLFTWDGEEQLVEMPPAERETSDDAAPERR